LVELLQRHARAVLLGDEVREVARELADQIAAGNPDRKAEALPGCRIVDDELDRKRVAMRRGDVDGVADHRAIVAAGKRRRSQARWRPCRAAAFARAAIENEVEDDARCEPRGAADDFEPAARRLR